MLRDVSKEWCVLQKAFDDYEKYSLLIKLLAVVIVTICGFGSAFYLWGVFLVGVLWLQDAIWKTFQSRIEERLLFVERQASMPEAEQNSVFSPYQFNASFLSARPSSLGLIACYARQAIKPTVAFPYIILILWLLCHACF